MSALGMIAVAMMTFSVSSEATAGEGVWGQLGVLDVMNANNGTNPVTSLPWARKDEYRLAFVTTAVTNTASTDITTYNAFVQSVAAGSSAFPMLGDATWKAMISTSTINARDNTLSNPGSGSGAVIFLINGVSKVADNNSDLWDGSPDVKINRTEENLARANDTPVWTAWCAVWTGSGSAGTKSSPAGDATVGHGLLNDNINMWMARSTAGNTVLLPMYALSEVLKIQGPAPGTVVTLH